MLRVEKYVVNMVQENTYLLWDESREAILIDPGFMTERNLSPLNETLERENLTLVRCLATHQHFDHYLGAKLVENTYGVQLEMPLKEINELPTIEEQMRKLMVPVFGKIEEPEMKPLQLDENHSIRFGETSIQVLETPGHSPGHVSFYIPDGDGILFCGDVLFKDSYGRYDLWGSSYEELMDSITEKLLRLPPSTVVYPGHGPATTIGAEQRNFHL